MRTYTRIWMLFTAAALMLAVMGAQAKPNVASSSSKRATAAQSAHVRRTARKAKLSAFIRSLNLTKDQRAQIRPMIKSARAEAKAVRADSSLARKDKVVRLKQIAADTAAKVRPVLNTEQQAKLDKFVARAKQHRASRTTAARARHGVSI